MWFILANCIPNVLRYSWEAHAGGHWAALVCAGIPFGVGAFSLFVSIRPQPWI